MVRHHGFVWALSIALGVSAAACGSDGDGGGSSGSSGAGASGGTGATGGGGVTCQQGCERVEQVCPDTWDTVAECVQQCTTEPFTQTSLDCVITATDCASVDACSD